MTPESIRVTLYRLEELPDLEHAVKLNDDITKNQTIVGGRNAIVCYGEKETKRAWWSEGFEAISNLKFSAPGKQSGAVVVIEDGIIESSKEVSAWAITFGCGYLFINQDHIKPEFGKSILMRALEPQSLSKISKASFDILAKSTSTMIPSGSSLREFDFEEMGEVALSLTGTQILDGIQEGKRSSVRGADSLNLTLNSNQDKLIKELDYLLAAYSQFDIKSEFEGLCNSALASRRNHKVVERQVLPLAASLSSNQLSISWPDSFASNIDEVQSFKIMGLRGKWAVGLGESRSAPFFKGYPSIDNLGREISRTANLRLTYLMKSLHVKFWDKNDALPLSALLTYKYCEGGQLYEFSNAEWRHVNNNSLVSNQQDLARLSSFLMKDILEENYANFDLQSKESCRVTICEKNDDDEGRDLRSCDYTIKDIGNCVIDEIYRVIKDARVRMIAGPKPDSDVLGEVCVKKWLTFRCKIEEEEFFYVNGKSYRLSDSYIANLNSAVEQIFDRGSKLTYSHLPLWCRKCYPNEKNYNRLLARALGGLCLDGKSLEKVSGLKIEPCDIVLKNGEFIYVKRVDRDRSVDVSHLLAQTTVSVEALLSSPQAQKALEGIIDDNEYSTVPRWVVVIFADKKLMTAKSLYMFSKINLVRLEKRMARRNVDLCVISARMSCY